jgi:chemotaxis response regulator CheB
MVLSSSHSPDSHVVKVLIADDSAFMRASISRMVESDDALRVVGTAETGLEAIAKIATLHPDVVTLDIDMPGLSGLETLKRIMAESPLPVIIREFARPSRSRSYDRSAQPRSLRLHRQGP